MFNVFVSVITGADNQTPAIGRVLALLLVLLSIPVPLLMVFIMAHGNHAPDSNQWGNFLLQIGGFWATISASATGLIRITSVTEPNSK